MTIWPSRYLPVRRSAGGALSIAAASLVLLGAAEAGAAPARRAPQGAAAPPVAQAPAAAPVAPAPVQLAPVAAPVAPAPAPVAPAAAAPAAAAPAAAAPAAPAPAAGGSGLRQTSSATDGVAVVAPTTTIEKKAAALASDAMNKDFLAMTYPAAEKKLRRAVQICMDQNCSAGFRARLHRDIGIIYVVGMNRLEDGKDEFATALTLDSTVAIASEMNNEDAEKAFLEVKYTLFPETRPPPPPPPPPANAAVDLGGGAGDKDSGSTDTGAWRSIANWVSFGIQQDIFIHSKTDYVCNSTRYRCWDAANTYQDYTHNPDVLPQGNQISSTKIKTATLRILVGYERLIRKNVSLGLKLGLVVGGKAPQVPTDPSVLSLHFEARGSYYFGDAPFEPTNKLRPYVFGAVGMAEVGSKVAVEIYKQNSAEKVLAWKRAGKFYLGAGVGSTYLLGKNHGPFIEGRFGRHMGSGAAYVGAIQVGYNYGF